MRPARAPDPKWLEFIAQFSREHGYPPTVREIQRGLGISSSSVVDYWLHRLSKEGRLTWQWGKVRTLRVVEAAETEDGA